MITAAESPTSTNRLQDIANFIKSVGGIIVETVGGLRDGSSVGTTPVTTIATTQPTTQTVDQPSLVLILIGVALIITAIVAGFLFSK